MVRHLPSKKDVCINLLHAKECEEEALGRESHPDKYLTEDSYPEYIQLEKKDQRNKWLIKKSAWDLDREFLEEEEEEGEEKKLLSNI